MPLAKAILSFFSTSLQVKGFLFSLSSPSSTHLTYLDFLLPKFGTRYLLLAPIDCRDPVRLTQSHNSNVRLLSIPKGHLRDLAGLVLAVYGMFPVLRSFIITAPE